MIEHIYLNDYLPFTEAVEYLGKSKTWFIRLVKQGKISTIQPYRSKTFYSIADMDREKVKSDDRER